MGYVFDEGTRFVTAGVARMVPLDVQVFLWDIIAQEVAMRDDVDYLQVFSFTSKDGQLVVLYSQEQPDINKQFFYTLRDEFDEFIDNKVYVIDDSTHSTMLFAHEY